MSLVATDGFICMHLASEAEKKIGRLVPLFVGFGISGHGISNNMTKFGKATRRSRLPT